MKAYFIRRLLLVPITLLGVTLIVFFVSRMVPGGPIDTMLKEASAASEGSKSNSEGGSTLTEEQLEALEEEFGYDKATLVAYFQWLGVWKKERLIAKGEFKPIELLRKELITDPDTETLITLKGSGEQVVVKRKSEDSKEVVEANFVDIEGSIKDAGWEIRIESPADRFARQARRKRISPEEHARASLVSLAIRRLQARDAESAAPLPEDPEWAVAPDLNRLIKEQAAQLNGSKEMATALDRLQNTSDESIKADPNLTAEELEFIGSQLSNSIVSQNPYRAVTYKGSFSGLVQGNLGRSSTYNDRVIDMILERIPIALYFGLLTAFITYGVCIPLGIIKALKHRTFVDNASSILIFIGYSVPGFALGAVLLVFLGARLNYFPLSGLVSPEFSELGVWGQIKDLAMHTVLPLISYVVGSFAITTMMMKNNLMDNLAADYVRTAVAKGVNFKQAVFRHAFRNSFIPIATGLGNLISIIVMGSMLIEQVFDIPGFGLLQFQAIQDLDQPVIMGTLTIAAFLMLVGNILSDVIVALIDPRIKFN